MYLLVDWYGLLTMRMTTYEWMVDVVRDTCTCRGERSIELLVFLLFLLFFATSVRVISTETDDDYLFEVTQPGFSCVI